MRLCCEDKEVLAFHAEWFFSQSAFLISMKVALQDKCKVRVVLLLLPFEAERGGQSPKRTYLQALMMPKLDSLVLTL